MQANGVGTITTTPTPAELLNPYTHLAGHIAGHLRGQAKLGAQVVIRRFLQPLATAHFPVGKGVGADVVEAQRDTRARVARSARNWSGVVSSFSLAVRVIFIPVILPHEEHLFK
jgi:hypothetical protein